MKLWCLVVAALWGLCVGAFAEVVIADAARLRRTNPLPMEEILVDDSQAAFFTGGTWTTGSFSGGYLGTYLWAGVSDLAPLTAYWVFDVTAPGTYELALYYTPSSNRFSSAQYRLMTSSGLREFTIDQKAGGNWSSAGSFTFQQGTYLLQLSNRMSTQTAEQPIVIDDGDWLFAKTGSWTTGTVSESYQGDYLYAGCAATTSAEARWRMPIFRPGNYDLGAWYSPGSNRTQDARYIVQHADGVTVRHIDQRIGFEGWHELGTFRFGSGLSELVLENSGAAGTVVIADALRARYSVNQGPPPPTIELIVNECAIPGALQPFAVCAQTWSASPITTVSASQVDPTGTTSTVLLSDDGAHGDGAPMDGIYGGYLPGGPAGSVLRYTATAANEMGGVATSDELKCLVACEESTRPELRWVFTACPKTAAEADDLLSRVRSGNFNAICPGVRNVADAYYHSSYEPLAAGVDPAYDPLGYLVAKAHETSGGLARIQVHPLVLIYRVLTQETPPPGHVLDIHPEWTSENYEGEQYVSNRKYMDQGIPEVQDYLAQVFMEIVRNYDIDGFNLDLVRYAAADWGYNPIALSWFHQFTGRSDRPAVDDPEWCEWRRLQVTSLVRRVAALIRKEKPGLFLSMDAVTWGPVLSPDNANDYYSGTYQDWTGWLQLGYVDCALGMAYRDESDPVLSAQFVAWQSFLLDHASGRRATAIVGAYQNCIQHSMVQLNTVRQSGSDVLSVFSDSDSNTQRLPSSQFYAAVRSQLFQSPVAPPAFPWLANPQTGIVMGTVRAADGSPLRMARVTLSTGAQQRTDLCGFYAFFACTPGQTVLEVLDMNGNTLAKRSIEITAGTAIQQDISLSTGTLDSSWSLFR